MSLAACISRWPSTTRWPWFSYSLLPRERLEHRRLRLLRLEEQRVVAVAAEHQHDPSARADAADADDLARQRRRSGTLEQPAPVARERARGTTRIRRSMRLRRSRAGLASRSSSIGTISGGSLAIRGSPSTSGSASRTPGGCPSSAPSRRPARIRLTLLLARACADSPPRFVDVEPRVPDVEVPIAAKRRIASR